MNSLRARRGSGVVSILVAAVILIVVFLFIASFGDTARRTLVLSLDSKRFQQRFPGAENPAKLDAAGRAALTAALTAALRDADPATRKQAGFALGRVGPEALGAVPELLRLFKTTDLESRRGALVGLEGIAGLNVPKPVQWTYTPDAMDWRARKALRAINTPEAQEAAAGYTGACPRQFKAPELRWCD